MLVLSRKAGESLVIGHDVVVTVVEFRGDQVRLGVKAPRSIQVHREEIYEEVSRQNREAAGIDVANRAGDRQAAKEMTVFLKRLDRAGKS